jgi:hypothetical protein
MGLSWTIRRLKRVPKHLPAGGMLKNPDSFLVV